MKVHFSIDDVIKSLAWLERVKAKSIFDSYTFSFAKWAYEEYGLCTTCNCLFTDGIVNLTNISSRWVDEFVNSNEWLKFSFHGFDYVTNYSNSDYYTAFRHYKELTREIIRICGSEAISETVRIHFFSGSSEALKAWIDCGVKEFFTADDNRISYDLTEKERDIVNCSTYERKDGSRFTKTDIRLEFYEESYASILLTNNRQGLVVFTHEGFINEPYIKNHLVSLMRQVRYNDN